MGKATKGSFKDGHVNNYSPRGSTGTRKRTNAPINAQYQRPVPTSKLEFITNDQHLELTRWLLKSGMSYNQIIQKIKEEFKIDTSQHALSRYFLKNVAQYLITRRQRNVDIALQVKGSMDKHGDEFVPLTLDNIKRLAWNLSNDPNSDPKTIKVFYELILRAEDNAIKRETLSVKMRRLDLLEKRLKAAEEAAADSKLSDTQFAERIRGIFKRNELTKSTNTTAATRTNGHSSTKESPALGNGITT